jgi:hypothetical protein
VISPVDYTIDESATMVAVCVGTGFPLPSISWSLDGFLLENNSRVSVYEEVIVESGITFVQSFLEVCSVGFMDAGLYQCTVANRLVNASSNFTLTVNRIGGELSSTMSYTFLCLAVLCIDNHYHIVSQKISCISDLNFLHAIQWRGS